MTREQAKDYSIIAAACSFAGFCIMAAIMVFNVGQSTPELTATMATKMDNEFGYLNGQFTPIMSNLNNTIVRLNRPCFGSGKQQMDNCGTLSLAGKLMVQGGDILKTTQMNEDKEQAILTTTLPSLATHLESSANHIDEAAAEVKPLIVSVKARVDELAPMESNLTLFTGNLNQTTTDARDKFNLAMDNINSLATNPDILTVSHNFATSTTTMNHMLFTADQFETKITRCTIHPHFTCYLKNGLITGSQIGGNLLH